MNRRRLLAWGILGIASFSGLAAVLASGGPAPQKGGSENWRLLEPVTYENLSVFPVVSSRTAETSGFLTLDEALASGEAVVTERGGEILRRTRDGRPVAMPVPYQSGASVNELVLVNRSSKPLILLAGELVSGGKQDRIIAKDRIVPVGAEPLPLNVFCVEQGRWSSGSTFKVTQMMVHPSVREKAAADYGGGHRGDDPHRGSQRLVCKGLSRVTRGPVGRVVRRRSPAAICPRDGRLEGGTRGRRGDRLRR